MKSFKKTVKTLKLCILLFVYRSFAGFIPRVLWIGMGGFVFLGAYEKSKHHLNTFF